MFLLEIHREKRDRELPCASSLSMATIIRAGLVGNRESGCSFESPPGCSRPKLSHLLLFSQIISRCWTWSDLFIFYDCLRDLFIFYDCFSISMPFVFLYVIWHHFLYIWEKCHCYLDWNGIELVNYFGHYWHFDHIN